MESQLLLTVNDQPISVAQAMRYLQLSGRLGPVIRDILREYVLEQELKQRDELDINPALIEQAVVDFRLQRQLTDPKRFQEWLANNRMDYPTFHGQVTAGFKLAKLKAEVTEPKLQEFFIERKIFLDRVVLSRIIVTEQELAEELRSQIEEGTAFETLARDYSLTEDRIVNGMMGPVSRGTLPDIIRAAIDQARPGELIGPIQLEGRWGLLRVEQILPASLEEAQLSEALQNELFELWITEKMQQMTVKLEVI